MNDLASKLLFDIVAACDEIERFLDGRTRAEYAAQALLRRAVERDVEIIGEAMSQLRRVDHTTFDQIPNAALIVAMRNRLIHGYADVDDDILWDVAHRDVPTLRQDIERISRHLR